MEMVFVHCGDLLIMVKYGHSNLSVLDNEQT
jgi:hypothetical protein